jgi:hypothetical protein
VELFTLTPVKVVGTVQSECLVIFFNFGDPLFVRVAVGCFAAVGIANIGNMVVGMIFEFEDGMFFAVFPAGRLL